MNKYKLYGLQRTGTNLVRWLVRNNFDVRGTERGGTWKHTIIGKEGNDKDIAILICYKDIWAWLVSMYRYSKGAHDGSNCKKFNKEWSFEEFCHNQHYTWQNPIERYFEVNENYINFFNTHYDRCFLFNSLLMMTPIQQELTINSVSMKFRWEFQEGLTEIKTQIKRVNNTCTLNKHDFNFDYYKNEEYMNLYTPELKDWIRSLI
jgi:hypothetical protein